MAAKITGASLQPILRRMNDAPNYHPFEADAFSDWSMNAGDLITINRGEESYTSPVNVSRMVWKGNAPTVQISSTGNKNREPIAKVSRKKYGRGSAGVRSQERVYLEFTSEDGILHSELQMTEASLRTEFVDYGNSLRGEFEMTASHLRTEFEDGVNSLRGSLEMTASHLRTEFNDDVNSLRSDFEMTASHLRTEFNDDVNSLRGEFEMTASRLRTEFEDDVNSLRGDFEMTASHLRTEFEDDVNSLRGDFEMTASRLRTEFNDDVNSLRGDFEMTASRLRTEFEDDVNSLRGDFEMTASHLRTEFGNDVNSLRGSLEMTASHLQTIFENDVNSLRGDFEVTAAGLRGEFQSGLSSMRGEFEVTASGLRGEFESGLGSMRGEFQVTASGLRGEFETGLSSMRGEFEVTASGLRSEFETATGSLRNEFEVTSSSFGTRISKVVDESGNIKTAQICVAINEDNSSEAIIEADKIHLLGQTIANTITSQYISNKIAAIATINANNILAGSISVVVGQTTSPVATETYVRGCPWDLRITQSGNTYTLQQKRLGYEAVWEDVGSFSRATTLGVGWDGNRKFTVDANPQGVRRYTTLVSAVPQAQQVWNGATGTLSLKATLDDGETTVDVGDITVNVSSFLQNKTSTAKFTANGTYTADQGYLGFGEITIDVPQGGTTPVDIGVRFSGSSGSYYAEAFDTVSGNPISGANAVYKLGLSGTKVQVQNSSGTLIGAEYQIPLQAKTGNSKLTSNGTYSPPSNYVGFSSVVVDVPSDLPNAKARFNVTSGQYYIEAFDNVSTNPISGSTVNYKLGFNGTKVQIQDNSGTKLSNTPELTLGINTGSLSSGSRTLTVTAGGSNTTVTATITDYTSGWNAAVDKVALPAEGSSSQCTFKVPGSTLGSQTSHIYHLANDGNNAVKLYITENNVTTTVATLTHNKWYAGKAAVTLNDPTWNAVTGSTPDHRTVTVSTANRTDSSGTAENLSKSVALYVTQGGWSGNSSDVFVRTGSTSGTVVAMRTVDATNRFTAGKNSAKVTGPTWTTTPSSGITGNSNTATFTTDADSPVSGASKSLALYMTQGSWSSNKKYVYVHHTNSTDANRIARVQVDASTLVTNAGYAGRAAVTISSTLAWTTTPASGISVNQNAVTVKTSGRTDSSGTTSESEKKINFYSQVGSWGTPAANKCYVYVTHTNSTEGNRILRREVDATSIYNNGKANADHTVEGFGTRGDSGYTYTIEGTSYTNNSSGYVIMSGSGTSTVAAIIVRGAWWCDGVQREKYNYLKAAPTNLYRNAYKDGWKAFYQTYHWPSSNDSSATITVSIPSSTAGSSWDSEQRNYVLQNKDDNTVYLRYSNVTYAQFAHNKLYLGKSRVTISDTLTWTTTPASGISVNQNAVTVKTSGRTTSSGTASESEKKINFYSQVGSWGTPAANKCYVYVTHTDSAEGHRILRREVDASSIYTNGKNDVWNGVSITNTCGADDSYTTVSGSGATKKVKFTFTTTVSSPGMTNKQKEDYWQGIPTRIWQDAYAEGVNASIGNLTITNTQTYTDSGDSNIHYQVISGSGYGKNLKHPFRTTVTNSSGTAVIPPKDDYWGATPTLIWKKAFEEGFKAALDSTKSYWWYGEETINNVRYWTIWTPKSSSFSKVADNHTPISSEGERWEAAKYRIPSSTSHSISQSNAYADNLATLANNLGASGSSELTDLGTFPAAGGRNYWGIRVSCGGAKKYYYVHTT